jgi:hypothetical protein
MGLIADIVVIVFIPIIANRLIKILDAINGDCGVIELLIRRSKKP